MYSKTQIYNMATALFWFDNVGTADGKIHVNGRRWNPATVWIVRLALLGLFTCTNMNQEAEQSEESILYELLVYSEWVQEQEALVSSSFRLIST